MPAPPESKPTFRELMEQAATHDIDDGQQQLSTQPPAAPRKKAHKQDAAPPVIRQTRDEFMRGGLQHREMRRLKRGKFHVGDNERIDLHGLRRNDAHTALGRFLDQCLYRGSRYAIVICGKGHHSPRGKPVLKLFIRCWLMDNDNVLAYCPALPEDGGAGALYVLLGRQRQSRPEHC